MEEPRLLDWVSPRKQREIEKQAAFLRYLLNREDKEVIDSEPSA